jgi:hypothetical protein
MNNLPLKSPGFLPPSPQGGVKTKGISKSPLGDLGVRKQRKFEVIGMEIKILMKNVLKPPIWVGGWFSGKAGEQLREILWRR